MSRLSTKTKAIIDKLLAASTIDPYYNLPNITIGISNSNENLYFGTSGYSKLPPPPTVLTRDQLASLPDDYKMKADSVYDIYSATKLCTVISLLQLVERGKLKLEDDARLYVKELNNIEVFVKMENGKAVHKKNEAFISVLNLVNHTLGAILPATDGNPAGSVYLPDATRETLTSRPLQYTPGTHWCYGFSNDWLGILIEDVTGLSLETYFQRNIFQPLGILDMSFLDHLPLVLPGKFPKKNAGHTFNPLPPFSQHQHFGGAGLRGSAISYLRIIQTIMRGGIPVGGTEATRILKQSTIDSMFKSSLPVDLAPSMKLEIREFLEKASMSLNDTVNGIELDWGLGGMLNECQLPSGRKVGSLTWSGYLNSYWIIDRKSDLCFGKECSFFVLCNTDSLTYFIVVFTNTLPWGNKAIGDLWAAVETELYKGLVEEKI